MPKEQLSLKALRYQFQGKRDLEDPIADGRAKLCIRRTSKGKKKKGSKIIASISILTSFNIIKCILSLYPRRPPLLVTMATKSPFFCIKWSKFANYFFKL